MIPRAMMGLRPVVFVPRTLVRTWGTRPVLQRHWKHMQRSLARVATVAACYLLERRTKTMFFECFHLITHPYAS
jgi:hypothetical protein